MTALTVGAVTKSFGPTTVLHGIDLHVPAGTFTAVLGPSGCGKTTLLRLVAGFDAPDSGTITLDGSVVAGDGHWVRPQHRKVGYVPQEGALFPHLTAAQNITFGLPRGRRSVKRVTELLELVGLSDEVARRYPHQLSGGQQQRIALARALAPGPAIVLLDEPFSSLDAALRDGTRRAVAQALRARGATAVLVTHDQDEALSMADQVAVMRDGRLVQLDDPATVYQRPADAWVAGFVGEAVILPGRVDGDRALSALGELPVTTLRGEVVPDGPVQLLVRPEQIRLTGEADQPGARSARVTEVRYYGHDSAVRVVLDAVALAVTSRAAGQAVPAVGERVAVRVEGAALVLPVPDRLPWTGVERAHAQPWAAGITRASGVAAAPPRNW